ncbi:hypothetical protein GCM10011402_32170 [Paracoccus acridae]|uniref:Uncharacterized protein n=1 Tax=Paracoccus acridae TaxID=1795310 RepID=A0ABQ1VLB9_9RHOB|nr:hypothetical protein [Paracoccus acridae]GGF77045.1 hypothetical protein GCM10011402_32170 [Paracoccus acridae]
MTEDDMEAETRRLNAETRLLLAKRELRDAKYPWLMFVPWMMVGAITATIVVMLVLVGAKS